jgi:hypothetical protein
VRHAVGRVITALCNACTGLFAVPYRMRYVEGVVPPLGVHIFMGETSPQKVRNAARNIEAGRTHPIQVVCRKPA